MVYSTRTNCNKRGFATNGSHNHIPKLNFDDSTPIDWAPRSKIEPRDTTPSRISPTTAVSGTASLNPRVNACTMATFQNGLAPLRALDVDSDVEEEALVADYKEQVQYEDLDEMEGNSLSMAQQADDIQARLAQAAQPLDFNAPLEIKFQSYDAYCSLFHFILNSDGPVDLEPPSVGSPWRKSRSPMGRRDAHRNRRRRKTN